MSDKEKDLGTLAQGRKHGEYGEGRSSAEEAFIASEKQFRELAEHMQDVLFYALLTPSLRFEYVSPSVERVVGYNPKDFYANPSVLVDIVHSDDRPIVERELQSPGSLDSPFLSRWVRKDGQMIWVEATFSYIRDENGSALAVEGVARDVTARRQAEESLRRSEARNRMLLEAAPEGIVTVDKNGKIALVNGALERLFGYSREELLGQPLELLMPERFRDTHSRQRGKFFDSPHIRPMGLDIPLVGRRKDGSEFPADISLTHVDMEEGRFSIGYVIDITPRKQAEEALSKARDLIVELSTPVLPVRTHLLLAPLIGVLDAPRVQQLSRQLLEAIRSHRAKVVVVDLTGVPYLDLAVAREVTRIFKSAQLLGAVVILTGMSSEFTRSLVENGILLEGITVLGDLQSGVEEAEQLLAGGGRGKGIGGALRVVAPTPTA